MINILIVTIGMFLNIFLESFFLQLFSFSLFVVLTISLYKRIGDIWFYTFLVISSIALDSVLHMHLGLHILVLSSLLLLLEISWLIIPRGSKSGYISIFLLFFSYYILLPISNSLILGQVFPQILPITILWILVKSLISLFLCILIDRFFVSLRDGSGDRDIRLK